MDEKLKDLLEFIASSSSEIKRSDVCDKFKISDPTASRWLDNLLTNGYIIRSGSGRSTSYTVDAADLYLLRKQLSGNNANIPYDFDRLDAYINGQSSFFTEEQKKSLNEAGLIPPGFTHHDYIASIQRKLMLEASWASSSLEGNTYSLIDTEELFDFGREKIGAKAEEALMLLNHKHAIEYIIENINDMTISRRDILNVHALLSDGLLKDPSDSGRVRFHPVGVGQSTYTPIDVNSLLSEQLNRLIKRAGEIKDVFDQSFYLLINIAYLQPFSDVNKRTSRMMSNIPFLKNSMIPMSFFQISKSGYEKGILHYYETGDFRRLTKEFVSCYVSSSLRFKDLLENKPTPEEIRIKALYRREISKSVNLIATSNISTDDAVNAMMPKSASDVERDFVIQYVKKAANGLNEANAILYGLTDKDVSDYIKSKRNSPANKLK